MKISFLVLFTVAFCSFTEQAMSQNARVSIKEKDIPINKVLEQIESQTDYLFVYNKNNVDVDRTVTVRVKEEPVSQVLNSVFTGTEVRYEMEGSHIILTSNPDLISAKTLARQSISITGTITDETGEPMPGVNVMVKGTITGVVTNIDGKYSITVPDRNAVLIFSFMGYSPQELMVGDRTNIDVILNEDVRELEEVVVIGYGTMQRRDLTGSVSSVSASQLKDIPVTSAAVAITGKMPGVQVTQTEGSPDAEIKIRVRGGGSITQDNSPLYIVDGFPVDNLGAIAPTDIASIDVLKDASSTAIYGARGANGVIIVTTKSGYEGKATVNYNMYYGQKRITKTLGVLNPYEYAYWQYEITGPGDNIEAFLGRFEDYALYNDMESTNWQKKCFGQTGSVFYNNLSITGGTKAIKYNVSVTRDDSKEVMVGSAYTRTNFMSKVNYTVNDWLSVEMNLRMSDQLIKGAGTDRNGRLQNMINYRPVPGIAGTVDPGDEGDFEVISSLTMDPYKMTLDDYRRNIQQTFNYNGAVNIKFLKNFTYRFSYGTQYTKQTIKQFYGLWTSNAQNNGSQPLAEKDKIDRRNWQIANTVTYVKRDFRPGHNVNIMAGQEVHYSVQERIRGSVKYLPKYIDPEGGLAMMNMGTADPIYTFDNAPTTTASFFGRAMYDYKGKYYLSATVRADGSSKFAPGYQWGVFPSVGAYWRISDETFMTGTKSWLTDLKLRASYGESGNNRISDDVWRKTLSINSNRLFLDGPLGSPTPYLGPSSTLANPTLKWETTVTRNIGLDFSVWKGRLSSTVEIYKNTTRDLLISATIPANTGYSTQLQNIGKTSNKGIEITLNGVIIDTRDFTLSGSFNIGFNKNKIDKLGETKRWEQSTNWGGADGSTSEYVIYEGGQVGLIYGYETDGNGMYSNDDFDYHADGATEAARYTIKPGVANNSGLTGNRWFRPGSLKFVKQPREDGEEITNWNVTADDDKVVIGNANPKHTGGFSLTAEYKGFDFSAFFNWVYGNDIFNVNKLCATNYWGGRRYKNILNIMNSDERYIVYHPETGAYVHDPAESAALNQGKKYWLASMNRAPLHSWAIEDGSFLRLNNLTIGYSLPKKILSKIGLEQLRIYATGYNLWIWTNYSGYDPEVDMIRSTPLTPGCDWNAYPRSRSYNIGLNVTF